MKELYFVILLAVLVLGLTVPVLIDSHMALAKNHVGPTHFPPDIIPGISHKHIDTNHNETLKK